MTPRKTKRSIANVKLTRKFHFRYLGLWMLMTACLVLVLNMVLLLYYQESWELQRWNPEVADELASLRGDVVTALVAEIAFFLLAILGMGVFTAHRIAGPYLRMKNVFNEVADGNLGCRIKFRKYDRLEDVEAAFNRMMDSVEGKAGRALGDANPGSTPASLPSK